jgi:squalene-hopene/tetraprenyl-beta-curcumene cyclase
MLMKTNFRLTEVGDGAYLDQQGALHINPIDAAIRNARAAIEEDQRADGHFVYELEADCTISAEYIVMMHFMDEIDRELEIKIGHYLRAHQMDNGGWPLYQDGEIDLSCSVKAYWALKLAGDSPDAAHMIKARQAILDHGGAARCNVFTRIALALFGEIPWRGVPFIPAEVILLPRWFPFHISKVSYWSRTVMVPLFILCTLKPRGVNPRGIDIRELFITPPYEEPHYFKPSSLKEHLFLVLDRLGRMMEPLVPKAIRQIAIKRCERWFTERLNGEDGLGGIFPAIVNAHEALALLGYPVDHPFRQSTAAALRKLLVVEDDYAYCQPCLSPVWDTALACHALHEAAEIPSSECVSAGLDWLVVRQLDDEPGDWRDNHPATEGGGWAFQYANPHYPDLDDTSMVGWIMYLVDKNRYANSIERAADWIHAMRCRDGGYGAFDSDNTHFYLNHIPFADHGALLDPPTADVTARCLALLTLVGKPEYSTAIKDAIDYLKREQEADGGWFGRWGTNYIYGTWSVLSALELVGISSDEDYVQKAVSWLKATQHIDGGWGESNDSYYPEREYTPHHSTSFQTAWAMLGLMAAGEGQSEAVRRGAQFLMSTQASDGMWYDTDFTAPGFPRVFYLRYHGYRRFFPLWALARYRNVNR